MKATVIELQEQDSTSYEQLQDEQLTSGAPVLEHEDKSIKATGVWDVWSDFVVEAHFDVH
jgi:hypothetical protein